MQGHKRLTLKGQRFVIRKLNPMIDFAPEKMPQIFSAHNPRRKAPATPPEIDEKKVMSDMMMIVEAGTVGIVGAKSEVVPLASVGKGDQKGREDWITVEDLFRDQEVGLKLYREIMVHALDHFSGIRKVFFYLLTRRMYFTS